MRAQLTRRETTPLQLGQLDIEMAFTPMEGIIGLGEELMVAAFEAGLGVTLPRPFPRMTYAEAMDRYGCDKPDTRFGMELRDVSAVVRRAHAAGFVAGKGASSGLCAWSRV
jgi:aspartyl-tRNA synthetase